MQFGVFFPQQTPQPWTSSSETKAFAGSLECVELADRIGIGYAWAQEHHFLEEYSHSSAPEVFLGACSQRTKAIRLGFGICVMPPAVNHPVRIAERIATLDVISGGRVEWGSGEMSSRLELEGFGIEPKHKHEMWLEAVREVARMLSTTPYPGHHGQYFSAPRRNVVPKPIQKPHPPLWMACSNRESVKYAASMGIGALTFAFMNPAEAKYWVKSYYDTLRQACHPIGRAINPNIAALVGFRCVGDGVGKNESEREAAVNLKFFKYGLGYYWGFGRHQPGKSSLWRDFESARDFHMAGLEGIGPAAEIARRFREYEETGLDQLILIQQCGRASTDAVCESLERFGKRVIEEFIERDVERQRRKSVMIEGLGRLWQPNLVSEDNSLEYIIEAYGLQRTI